MQTQVEKRKRALPLRARIKEIFKKYGLIVTSILLAAGVTIGVVVGTVTNALKATGKALGAGLKDIGSKIGQVASFLSKRPGRWLGF